MTSYVNIGKMVSAHGLSGELIVEHHLGKKTSLSGVSALFIEERKGSFIPYFIVTVNAKSSSELLVTLEGISNREQARKLLNMPVWLQHADFEKHAAKSAPISLLGFHIIDGEHDLGPILEVIEQEHQILCTILYKGKEAMIPLHEESLIKTDKKNRKVFVELPDGLLDIYAG